MKKILITGANSYIGTSFEAWMTDKRFQGGYELDTLDMMNESWKEYDFSSYDVVFHVAGIAHADIRNATKEVKQSYYDVNTDLAVEAAKIAKAAGVKQFIFMSSMIVFGDSSRIRECRITKATKPQPANFYGDSKLQADIGLHKLQSNTFHVVSVRPPMIYGKGSRGNYPRLARLAKRLPVFPAYKNERSMLHIDNLCEFIRLMVDNEEAGIFYPQNREYVCTAQLVKQIRELSGRRMHLLFLLNPLVELALWCSKTAGKVFGTMVYAKDMSDYMDFAYCVNNFEESVKKTEV